MIALHWWKGAYSAPLQPNKPFTDKSGYAEYEFYVNIDNFVMHYLFRIGVHWKSMYFNTVQIL